MSAIARAVSRTSQTASVSAIATMQSSITTTGAHGEQHELGFGDATRGHCGGPSRRAAAAPHPIGMTRRRATPLPRHIASVSSARAVVLVRAILAGPTARTTAVCRRIAPVLDGRAGVAWDRCLVLPPLVLSGATARATDAKKRSREQAMSGRSRHGGRYGVCRVRVAHRDPLAASRLLSFVSERKRGRPGGPADCSAPRRPKRCCSERFGGRGPTPQPGTGDDVATFTGEPSRQAARTGRLSAPQLRTPDHRNGDPRARPTRRVNHRSRTAGRDLFRAAGDPRRSFRSARATG